MRRPCPPESHAISKPYIQVCSRSPYFAGIEGNVRFFRSEISDFVTVPKLGDERLRKDSLPKMFDHIPFATSIPMLKRRWQKCAFHCGRPVCNPAIIKSVQHTHPILTRAYPRSKQRSPLQLHFYFLFWYCCCFFQYLHIFLRIFFCCCCCFVVVLLLLLLMLLLQPSLQPSFLLSLLLSSLSQ